MNPTDNAISSSLAGLTEQYRTITQNLAAGSATGYKRRRTAFSQALANQVQANGIAPSGPAINTRTAIDFSQGSFTNTGNGLDMAIDGKGFFTIDTPSGPVYTRSGSFALNQQGQLVDSIGRTVAGASGPIVIPPTVSLSQISVASGGEVFAAGQSVGKLKIVEFARPQLLQEAGNNHFKTPAGVSPSPVKDPRVRQGYQESSNVNVVEELVNLITVTKMYEANLKNVQSQDERGKSLMSVAMH